MQVFRVGWGGIYHSASRLAVEETVKGPTVDGTLNISTGSGFFPSAVSGGFK